MGGLGPMAGQNHHFGRFAPDKISYAIERYRSETSRLYGVLNGALEGRDFIADTYSIADMACYPWIARYEWQEMNLDEYPNVRRWFDQISARSATQTAYQKEKLFVTVDLAQFTIRTGIDPLKYIRTLRHRMISKGLTMRYGFLLRPFVPFRWVRILPKKRQHSNEVNMVRSIKRLKRPCTITRSR